MHVCGMAFIYRSINGVKEMQGFRETFGIPYTSDNESSTCSDDVEASATLVRQHMIIVREWGVTSSIETCS